MTSSMDTDEEWAEAERQWDALEREDELGGGGGGRLAADTTAKGTKTANVRKRKTKNGGGCASERRLKRYTAQGKQANGGAGCSGGSSSKAKTAAVPIDVGLTGARAGDTLQGCGTDTVNVVLRIDSGEVTAPAVLRRSVEGAVGREAVVASFAKAMGMSRAAAEMRYADCPTSEVPNHCPLGQSCSHRVGSGDCGCEPAARFTILNQGIWQTFADEHGRGEQLQAMVAERRSVCYRDVLQLMSTPGKPGGKLLILRPKLFRLIVGPTALAHDDPRLSSSTGATAVLDGTKFLAVKQLPQPLRRQHDGDAEEEEAGKGEKEGEERKSEVFEMDGFFVRVPVQPRGCEAWAVRRDEVCSLVAEALQGLVPAEALSAATLERCMGALTALSVGGLKSLLQKTIRYHARTVDMSLAMGTTTEEEAGEVGGAALAAQAHTKATPASAEASVPASVVAALSAALLFAETGVFSPELQLFTRGCTAALKRLAIILVEDAWVPGSEQAVLGLLCLALATQRMGEYLPPRRVVLAALRLAARAADAETLIAWRADTVARHPSSVAVNRPDALALEQAAKVLWVLRSFECDMKMLSKVAKIATGRGALRLSRAVAEERAHAMPLCHAIDQHTYRGVAHLGRSGCTLGASFADRFRTIFERTTGYNPRVTACPRGGLETQPCVMETRFAQKCVAAFALKVAARHPLAPIQVLEGRAPLELSLRLDAGALAAAVGPIRVKVSGGGGGRQRELLVMLGVRCPEDEVVMLRPARQTRDLWGSVTDAERAQAIAALRSMTLSARSPVLDRGLHEVAFRDGSWQLDGVPWADVVAAGRQLQVPLVVGPTWAATLQSGSSSSASSVLSSNEAVEEALSAWSGGGVVPKAAELITALVRGCSHAVVLRAVSFLRQQYTQVVMPTPALDGGIGADQLAAYSGDWDVYRLLVLVSRLAPGAIRPSMPPKFTVVDAHLLRVLERWLLGGMRAQSRADIATATATSEWGVHSLWQRMAKAEGRLMEHQRAAVASMHRRDRDADTGHFLIMDTGVGKTVTALCYLYRWLVQHGSTTRYIFWVTPAGTVDNLVQQLCATWAAPVWSVPRVSTSKQQRHRLVLKPYHVNVLQADHLRVAIDAGLTERAPESVICFDEVDELYAATLRTSAARRLAQLCQKFVCQTATPMRKNESQLRAWLADTCSFPVDAKNLLVAASGMVSIQLELGIVSREVLQLVPMIDTVRSRCLELSRQRSWLPMAQFVQAHTDAAMVDQAVMRAVKDRVRYKDGGVLLVADTLDHAEKLIAMCNARGEGIRAGGFDTLELPNAADFGVVVVNKTKDRGYNSACRLGCMVTGAYAGNGASRHQIRGRLRRLGQQRKTVTFCTICMENSLLHLLHLRHEDVDLMNMSLQQLGDSFSADVLRALHKQSTAVDAAAADESTKSYCGDNTHDQSVTSSATAVNGQRQRRMKGLLNHRTNAQGVEEYKVRWVDADEPDSWLPASQVSEAQVKTFHRKRAERDRKRKRASGDDAT